MNQFENVTIRKWEKMYKLKKEKEISALICGICEKQI